MKTFLYITYLIVFGFSFNTVSENNNVLDKLDIQFNYLSVNDGLSQVAVNDIVQDSDGFMWFATQGGLDRYDGKGFVNYEADEKDKNSIPGNYITFARFSKSKTLWIGTNGQGVAKRTFGTSKFVSIPFYSNENILSTIQGKSFLEDSIGNIWIGTANHGVFKYDKNNNRFVGLWQENEALKIVWSMVEWNGNILVGTENTGIWQYSVNAHQQIFSVYESVKAKKIQDLLIVNNHLWIATNLGLWVVNSNLDVSQIYKKIGNLELHKQNVYKLFFDSNANLWVSILGQGILMQDKFGHWFHYKTSKQNKSLSNNRVFSIFQDRTGIIWIGTESAGLNYFDPHSKIFHHLSASKKDHRYLNDSVVYAIHRSENSDWWIGTEAGGVNHWLSKNKNYQYYTKDSKNLLHNTVRDIMPWNNQYWIATFGGLVLLDKNGMQIDLINTDNTPKLGHNAVLKLTRFNDHSFWIAGYGGLDLYDTKKKRIVLSKRQDDENNPLPRNFVSSLWQTDKYLWVGTLGQGLVRYRIEDMTAKYFKHQSFEENSLSNDTVVNIFQSANKNIWIGTYGGGLNLFRAETESFTQYRKANGLANEFINGISEDDDGAIWVSTNRGLSRLSYDRQTVDNYFIEDGLLSQEFSAGAVFQNENILAFGGVNGVTWFYKGQGTINPYPPQTKIVDFLLNNQSNEFLEKSLNISINEKGEQRVELEYDEKMLSLEFRALHYSVVSRNHFKYRLLGVNDEWISSKPDQFNQSFTGLSSGQYIFEVYAISKDNIADKTPARVHIIVKPPPWLTWWAYSSYIAIVALLFWIYRKNHLNRLSVERTLNRRLIEIDGLKESLSKSERMAVVGELASNITHSLRNPLANIRTTAEMMEFNDSADSLIRQDANLIVSEVDRLSQWIKELLHFSKEQEQDEIFDLVDVISKLVSHLSNPTNIRKKLIKFNMRIDVQQAKIKAEQGLVLHMINSLITNAIDAIEHEGTIRIEISKTETIESETIKLSIIDTGCGMNNDFLHLIFEQNVSNKPGGLGVGLSLVKRISERYGIRISVSSKVGIGSTFDLFFKEFNEGKN